MLLTITNTRPPATDLGWLLHKHPDKVQPFRTTGGQATVFYPEATEERCTAALLLTIDPIELVRGAGPGGHALSTQYVNDRPYVASSLLSSALTSVYSSALNGRCVDRPDLVETPLPLTVTLAVVRVQGWPDGVARLFEPLGYAVEAVPHPLDERFPDWGQSPYFTVTLRNTLPVRELLAHLYVLLPVLDNSRHSFVQEQDVDVLVKKGGNWLARHPERTAITRRFLRRQAGLTRLALDRLLIVDDAPADDLPGEPVSDEETTTPFPSVIEAGSTADPVTAPARRLTLHEQRLDAVLAGLLASGARSVLDLGCGEGQLLRKLVAESQFSRILGMDVAYRELLRAKTKLHYEELPPSQRDRLTLLQGSLLYRDQRLEGFDAAALVEVIEHVESARLPDLTRVVFGFIAPQTVFITTPNAEYNELYGLDENQTRHDDHRFEWSRAEFSAWCTATADRFGYQVSVTGVGEVDELVGASSQLARFQKNTYGMMLDIPELSLVVLVGASSSGKSTFARQHFRPTEIISSDQCRAFVSDDPADQSATDDAFDLLHHWVGLRLKRGRLTVVDATNVQPFARKSLIELARQHHVLPVAIVLDLPERTLLDRHRARTDRNFGPHVLTSHRRDLHRWLGGLEKEGFRYVHLLKSESDIAAVQLNRTRTWNDRRTDTGPFDIIGDVHGCYPELLELFAKLGYTLTGAGESVGVVPPAGRKAVFVGDLADRGPDSPAVLQLVMNMVRDGVALCVPGNHDDKLYRYLSGKKVLLTHGLDQTIAQMDARPPEFRQQVRQFLGKLVSHYVLDNGRLVVAHAGLPEAMQGRASGAVRAFCLYGETTGETDEYGLPVRLNWAANYRGRAMVVHGHVPVPTVEWLNNVIDIDTGCCFGGQLTSLRYPEKELVSVPAHRVYSEPKRPLVTVSELPIARPDLQTLLPSVAETAGQNKPKTGTQPVSDSKNEPFIVKPVVPLAAQQAADGVLDLADVLGRRTVLTRVGPPVKIPEENAIAALEVMSRFAIAPQWLLYLPPTMSPVETSPLPDYLEHPTEAFAYYQKQGVERVVCEEKHMGSRTVVIVCREPGVAQTRFGLSAPADGVVYTRTGRAFFTDPAVETALLHRLQTALTRAGFWERFATDWIALDAELLPWSAKARELIRSQYAAVGAAGTATLSATAAVLAQAAGRGLSVQQLQLDNAGQTDRMVRFRDAYGQYCRAVDGIEGLTLAPFHVLATEGRVHTDQPHDWHLAQIADLCAADSALLTITDHRFVDLADPASMAKATDWWECMTRNGGEGMVVKPLAFVPRAANGSGPTLRLIQPAVKCRGREYLRIIYGPDYDTPDHLAILKKRGLQVKRSLALREFALGLESLGRFVAREPLRRVHECTFGVLALESEDVDSTL